MAITALPTPPSRQDPTNFNDRADAFLGALPTFATEANALQINVNTSEANAVASAAAVLAATNIVKWVSGTTYANGAVVWSPINGLAYRRITTSGSGTTDPSADTTNYKQVNGTGDVSTSGNQTIAGTKTFTSTIIGDISGSAARLNGQLPSYYQTALGFTPVQQGTGTGQLSNVVKIGWTGSRLAVEVDNTDFGTKWPIYVDGSSVLTITDMPVLSISAADTYDTGNGITATSSLTSSPSTSYVVAHTISIQKYTGSMRFKAAHTCQISTDPEGFPSVYGIGYLALYKNNSLVQEFSNSTTAYIQRVVDVSIAPGDVIEWRIRCQYGPYAGINTSFRYDRTFGSNGYTGRTPLIAFI